jgi:hypothetical protein
MRQILTVNIAANIIRKASMMKNGYSVSSAVWGATKNFKDRAKKEISFAPFVFSE